MKNSNSLANAMTIFSSVFLVLTLAFLGVSYLSMEDAKTRIKFYQSSLGTKSMEWDDFVRSKKNVVRLIGTEASFEDEGFITAVAGDIEKGISSSAPTYIKVNYLEDFLALNKLYNDSQVYSPTWEELQNVMALEVPKNQYIWLRDLEGRTAQVAKFEEQMWKAKWIDSISPWFLQGQEQEDVTIEALNKSIGEAIDKAKQVIRRFEEKTKVSSPIKSTLA